MKEKQFNTATLIVQSKFLDCFFCNELQSQRACHESCTYQYCNVNNKSLLYVECSFKGLKVVPEIDLHNASIYNIAGNIIQTLDNNSFSNAHNLKILCLGKNELNYREIALGVFQGLMNLQSLNFQENVVLRKLRKSWFSDLVSLTNFSAPYCGISMVEEHTFANCKQLKLINLSNNRIMTIYVNVFQNLQSLTRLYLSNNRISRVMDFPFKGSEKLMLLILHNNQLTTITKQFGLQNMTGLKAINLAFNLFSCDCQLVWFLEWINTTNVTIQNTEQTACVKPEFCPVLEFDRNELKCNTLWTILTLVLIIVIPSISILIVIMILYNYRHKIRYWNQRRINRKQYKKICNENPMPVNGVDIRYDAFVSYHDMEQRWVLSVLQPTLEEHPYNFKLCLDYRDFIAGEKIIDNIENAIKYSRKMLLVVSNSFASGEWSYFELERARMRIFDNREDILVVILLEKLLAKNTPVLLQHVLSKNTYIEWSDKPDKQRVFWLKLIAALQKPNVRRNDQFKGCL
ncbi:toll-like receptor 4 [Antedon mediterranea]|uniref:toll-like receptor 4 n=1 Tax=Antedon mediterranea TaxID=105859 RepID=UPI003AF9C9AE